MDIFKTKAAWQLVSILIALKDFCMAFDNSCFSGPEFESLLWTMKCVCVFLSVNSSLWTSTTISEWDMPTAAVLIIKIFLFKNHKTRHIKINDIPESFTINNFDIKTNSNSIKQIHSVLSCLVCLISYSVRWWIVLMVDYSVRSLNFHWTKNKLSQLRKLQQFCYNVVDYWSIF